MSLLARRNYDLLDEEKPFGLDLIATLILRERKIVRDIAISRLRAQHCSLWRRSCSGRLISNQRALLQIDVHLHGAVRRHGGDHCLRGGVHYLRSYLLLFLASRVDTRLSEYLFDRMIQLPVDYFERTQIGKTMHDINEIWKIRDFLTGQLFGVVLDSLVLLIFLPVMFAFSPLAHLHRSRFLRC